MKRSLSTARRGLTLIELVVVVAILAVLAGLVVPRLSFLQDSAGSATSAATASQLVGNLETFKTARGGYPKGFDTLLTTTGALYDKLWSHTGVSTWSTQLEVYTMPTTGSSDVGYATSVGHSFALNNGAYALYDHTSTTATSTVNTATVLRSFGSSNVGASGPYSMKEQKVATVVDTSGTSDPLVVAAGYPTGDLPTGVKLLALGIGANSDLAGVVSSIPVDGGQSTTTYGRFVALFKMFSDGSPARLAAVVDSFGTSISGNVTEYKTSSVQ